MIATDCAMGPPRARPAATPCWRWRPNGWRRGPIASWLLEAWRLIALHDPARSAVAHQVQAQLLLSGPDPASRAAGLQALAAAVAAAPQEASFWALSWQQRKQGHAEQAGETLVAGGAAWEAAGAGHIASALRDRAAELAAAARPDALLDRLPARSFTVDLGDDPRQLARELLVRADDPKAMASTWTAAATGGSALRVAEAAGWLIEAGKPAEALGWLMDAGSHGDVGRAVAVPAPTGPSGRRRQPGNGAVRIARGAARVDASDGTGRAGDVAGRGAGAVGPPSRGRRSVPRAAGGTAGRRRRPGHAPGAVGHARRRRRWSRCGGTSTTPSSGRVACEARPPPWWRRPGSSATCAATPRPPPRSCARRWRRIRDIRWPG